MVVTDLSSLAATLREQGYEARNMGQVGLSVWKDGQGLFLPADEVRRLNGDLAKEVAHLMATRDGSTGAGR